MPKAILVVVGNHQVVLDVLGSLHGLVLVQFPITEGLQQVEQMHAVLLPIDTLFPVIHGVERRRREEGGGDVEF